MAAVHRLHKNWPSGSNQTKVNEYKNVDREIIVLCVCVLHDKVIAVCRVHEDKTDKNNHHQDFINDPSPTPVSTHSERC